MFHLNTSHGVLLLIQLSIFQIFFPCVSAWELSSSSASSGGSFCARLFSEDKFAGIHVQLQENVQISNFQLFRNRISDWESNSSISFQIEKNCSLQLATEPYLKGEITEFDRAQEAVSQDLTGSLSCTCDKHCNCGEIKLKYNECARAYLEAECSHCNAYYTTLKPGSRQLFPIKLAEKVKSLVLRNGCSLRLGDGTIISDAITQTWTGNLITNYDCTCNATTSTKRAPAPDNGIPMIDIPKHRSQINSMLQKEGNKQHPGLIGGLQSLRIKRSSKNAYILLLGLTGSGKSTTVNFLFNHPNITKVGGVNSTTTDILEFRIPVPVHQLGMKNSELRIIDTPGIADTRGIAQDAQFLATLEAYFAKHEDLKHKIPNVVLIFFNFNDNRFLGEGSSFVKMLKTVELFRDRMIDRKYSNIVFVLTHFMSESKDITRDPSAKLANIRRVIQEQSTLPNPIILVVAENKPDLHELQILNGYYRLPNGEFYPQNLFAQIERVLVGAGDPVGNAIIQTAFQNSEDMEITCKPFSLMPKDHPKVVKYLDTLGKLQQSIDHTEISKLLNAAYQNVDPELKRSYPETLRHLKRVCHVNEMFIKTDLPQTSIQILKFLKEIHQNPLAAVLVQNAFNITIPTFKGDLFVGSGYDILNDRPLATTILDRSAYFPTDSGFQFPSNIALTLLNQIVSIFQIVERSDLYLPQRASDLGLQELQINTSQFNGEFKPGFNIVNQNKLSALLEYHLFQANLKHTELHPEFVAVLMELPNFNQSDWEAVQAWNDFFSKYGTHIVVGAIGGGSIEITVENTANEASELSSEGFAQLTQGMGDIVQHMANSFIGEETVLNIPAGLSYKIEMHGGETKYQFTNFSHTLDNPVDKWKESVEFNPVMLQTYLTLMPITEVIKLAPQQNSNLIEVSERMEVASRALFNSTLVYVPVTTIRSMPNSRDRTVSGTGNAIGDFEAVQEFAKLFKTMNEKSTKMQETYLQLMMKAQDDAKVQDEIFEREQQEKKEALARQAEIEREDKKFEQGLAIERERLEAKRESDEAASRLQIEFNRQQIQASREAAREQLRVQEQQMLMEFIIAENQRISEERKNNKGWFDKTLEAVTGLASNPMIMAPLMAAG